jgi:spore photoproduct lyase
MEIARIDNLLDISTIYMEPAVADFDRGREVLQRFPHAERIEVPSHWKIPSLHGNEGSIEDWVRIKKNVLVLGIKKSITCRPNERSSHFVAPSLSNGCAMACAYCYVPRRKGFANPITLFVNIGQIMRFLEKHAARQPMKFEADQIDPTCWVYDIGENGDCSVDAALSDNVRDIVQLFSRVPNAKATFATKFVNTEMLDYDPRNKTRVRFSLMPQSISKVVDVRTSSISDRINAMNDFVAAGYEVHINFSPVIYYENWLADYRDLMSEIDDKLNAKVKAQLKAEVIFLTHNTMMHDINMEWHPKGEELLWKPQLQETKYSQTGGRNLRYRRGLKTELVSQFTELMGEVLPYCEIRYAF